MDSGAISNNFLIAIPECSIGIIRGGYFLETQLEAMIQSMNSLFGSLPDLTWNNFFLSELITAFLVD